MTISSGFYAKARKNSRTLAQLAAGFVAGVLLVLAVQVAIDAVHHGNRTVCFEDGFAITRGNEHLCVSHDDVYLPIRPQP